MNIFEIHLKDSFPELCSGNQDPFVKVYLPDNIISMGRGDDLRPCVIVCPGGGYCNCSDREAEVVALPFVAEGYNAFVLNYSCRPSVFPAQLREVAALMELIHQNAETWHCDVDKIAIMGFSAGGHLAAHYSTCYDCAEVREMFPDSKPVQATILGYPVITADPADSHKGSFVALTGHAELTDEDVEKFSLENRVTEHTPPAFIWHTAADNTVPVGNSLRYARALANFRIPFALHVYPYGVHGLSTVDLRANFPEKLDDKISLGASWLPDVFKWLKVL